MPCFCYTVRIPLSTMEIIMTQTNLIERRKKAFEQRRNRLKQMESSLNVTLRKERTRRLIELGGVVAKAKVDEWPTHTLLGALLFLKDKANTDSRADWAYQGRLRFAVDTRHKTQVHVTFPSFPEGELLRDLETLGFTWNVAEYFWDGYGDVRELKLLLEPQGGLVREAEGAN